MYVWREEEPTPTAAAIDGQIEIADVAEAIVLAGPEALTLQLEDGRRLPFALTSTHGRVVARGAIES